MVGWVTSAGLDGSISTTKIDKLINNFKCARGDAAQTQASPMWLRLVIKLKVIVPVETARFPYGLPPEIKAFDLSMDPCRQSGPAKFHLAG